MNVENLTKLKWWTRDEFSNVAFLDAFETLAFEYLDPQLRSRGGRLKVVKPILTTRTSKKW